MQDSIVADALGSSGAAEEVFAVWRDIVAQEIEPEDEDAGY